MAYNLKNRSFLKEIDFEPAELRFLLRLSEALKLAKYAGTETAHLAGKEIALIFEKTSTRTRSAFEVGAYDQITYAFCGDCRFNMGRSLLVMGALMGSDVRLAGPAELHPPKDVSDIAHEIAGRTGARITLTEDPAQAVTGADFIHTDVWVSMGEAKDVWSERVRVLTPYQVNADLMRKTGNPKVKFMHCLPAFHDTNTVVGREIMEHTGMTSGLEVTDEVFTSGASIVFDQAENRLHTIKAVLVATLG